MRNLTLLTDFYELTMMNGFFKEGVAQKKAVFDLYFRKQSESNYAIFAGLLQAAQYIKNLKFTTEDLSYLKSLKIFGQDFLDYLKTFKFSGSIKAVPEGTVIFPDEPILAVKAPIIEAVLLESALLNILNHQTLIATKASRMCFAAGGGAVTEFGLRRAQGPDAAIYGARAAIIGGCAATSNVLAGSMFGISIKGTMAHSYVMAFKDELTAFRSYAKIYPDDCLLLVDTFDTLRCGVPNAITVFDELKAAGHKPKGIRLDSGDFAYLSKKSRIMLDNAGHNDAGIFASSDLDEYTIQSLRVQGAKIDTWGVGTKLITSYSSPSLGGVYKLAAIEENGVMTPKIKISNNQGKTTIPGEKEVYRLFDENKKAVADLITLENEVIKTDKPLTIFNPIEVWRKRTLTNFEAKKIMTPIFKDGELIYEFPPLEETVRFKKQNFECFWDEYKRLERPQLYSVDLSKSLYELRQGMISGAAE
jgi:nicotinate phosphoribosyltransferase